MNEPRVTELVISFTANPHILGAFTPTSNLTGPPDAPGIDVIDCLSDDLWNLALFRDLLLDGLRQPGEFEAWGNVARISATAEDPQTIVLEVPTLPGFQHSLPRSVVIRVVDDLLSLKGTTTNTTRSYRL